MTIPSDLGTTIRELEESLLRPEVRADPEQLAALLADEFVEIGSSGRRFEKVDVIEALPSQSGLSFSLSDFESRPLGAELVLATYRVSVRDGNSARESLRSSLWVRRSGRWQMLFHQGTPAEAPRD